MKYEVTQIVDIDPAIYGTITPLGKTIDLVSCDTQADDIKINVGPETWLAKLAPGDTIQITRII